MSDKPTEITVLRFPDGWWRLVTAGTQKGRFQYRVDAEEAALGLAARLAKAGHAVRVFVQQPFGELVLLQTA
jgi:hypothetical protein